jgi:RNA polymerase sigma-70 factor (ECF subfamily)
MLTDAAADVANDTAAAAATAAAVIAARSLGRVLTASSASVYARRRRSDEESADDRSGVDQVGAFPSRSYEETFAVVEMLCMSEASTDLIRRMAAGDQQAFSQFYDRHAPLAYRLVARIVRDPEDAADVLQEVFWSAWKAAGSYDADRGTPEAWIITRARSRALDRLRSVRRKSATFVAPVDEVIVAAPSGPEHDPGQAADRVTVKTALERLAADEREVLELAYYAGLTQTEIAKQLRAPLGTVKTRMRRALERLQGILGKLAR